jgi:hypothetical protein
VATDFAGTNTEKIDKLVATVIELRTTLRICLGVIGITFPLLLGLITFLVVKSFDTSAKLDRLTDQVTRMDRRIDEVSDRLNKLEHKP